MSALGRLDPPDREHVEKYPLSALRDAAPTNVPVVIGINWYTNFDSPVRDGREYWIGRGDLGSIRGGHCICIEPARGGARLMRDNQHWWSYYDQGNEGACTGFGASRAMSLLNRHRYQAYWLYRTAQDLGHIPRSSSGAYVRDALEVLRSFGHVLDAHPSRLQVNDAQIAHNKPRPSEGIQAFRWATTVEEVLSALGTPGARHVTLLNSWGTRYPQRTNLPVDVLDRLIRGEGGEAGVVTDR